ncbi:MAG TPA: hypothetical protein VLB27_07870 [candidate division Zixibacteria bacterium]|nr:hypothetical protein [candidate division Zixibacteria bacterium]
MRKSLLVLVALVAALPGCNGARLAGPGDGARLSFAPMAVGQTSSYVRFVGERYWDPADSSFAYFADTLVITVLAREGDWFVIQERLSPGSRSLSVPAHADSAGLWSPHDVYLNRITVRNDSLIFQPDTLNGGTFLFGYAMTPSDIVRDVIPLFQITGPELALHGWKTEYCECYMTGTIPEYRQLGRTYRNLNIVVDNIFMQTDGPGFTTVYSKRDGIVHSFWANWWTGQGFGWDLI